MLPFFLSLDLPREDPELLELELELLELDPLELDELDRFFLRRSGDLLAVGRLERPAPRSRLLLLRELDFLTGELSESELELELLRFPGIF